jgi:hypothetical protein
MATATSAHSGPNLPPIDTPTGLRLKLLYPLLGRQFGKVPGWLTVSSARMPLALTSWMGKVYRLNNKLELPQDTMRLVRARVDGLNGCTWCGDAGRWYAMTNDPDNLPKIDAIAEHQQPGLGIGSDGLCELAGHHRKAA